MGVGTVSHQYYRAHNAERCADREKQGRDHLGVSTVSVLVLGACGCGAGLTSRASPGSSSAEYTKVRRMEIDVLHVGGSRAGLVGRKFLPVVVFAVRGA